MGLDDRDYIRNRYQTSEQQKIRQAENLKKRFAAYGGIPSRSKVSFRWKTVLIVTIVLTALTMIFNRLPEIKHHFSVREIGPQFPRTGEVRWFVSASSHGASDTAPLSITGLTSESRNVVVELSDWETRAPIAIIPVRAGETATLQVPLGRYRLRYASNASWQGAGKLLGDIQEAVDSIDFYRENNQIMGRHIDINGRINGNLKTRPASFF